jgi:hypothetical protein
MGTPWDELSKAMPKYVIVDPPLDEDEEDEGEEVIF